MNINKELDNLENLYNNLDIEKRFNEKNMQTVAYKETVDMVACKQQALINRLLANRQLSKKIQKVAKYDKQYCVLYYLNKEEHIDNCVLKTLLTDWEHSPLIQELILSKFFNEKLDLSYLNIQNCNLSELNFSGWEIKETTFSDCILDGVNFDSAVLNGTEFFNCSIKRCTFFNVKFNNKTLFDRSFFGHFLKVHGTGLTDFMT